MNQSDLTALRPTAMCTDIG